MMSRFQEKQPEAARVDSHSDDAVHVGTVSRGAAGADIVVAHAAPIRPTPCGYRSVAQIAHQPRVLRCECPEPVVPRAVQSAVRANIVVALAATISRTPCGYRSETDIAPHAGGTERDVIQKPVASWTVKHARSEAVDADIVVARAAPERDIPCRYRSTTGVAQEPIRCREHLEPVAARAVAGVSHVCEGGMRCVVTKQQSVSIGSVWRSCGSWPHEDIGWNRL